MAQNNNQDWLGEYIPEPFEFKGNIKSVSIAVAVLVWIASVIILGNTLLVADENDLLGILNFVISTGLAVLAYYVGYGIAKLGYNKKVEEDREAYEEEKKEAIPFTTCEFCGGALQTKFYRAGNTSTDGTKYGIQSFTCPHCRYIVGGHTYTTYASPTANLFGYSLIETEVSPSSPITEDQLKNGKLVSYLKDKKKVYIARK